jgi:hypothetical protein
MGDARQEIKVFDKTYTVNDTDDPSGGFPQIDAIGIKAPYTLTVKTSDGGATAPTVGLSFVVEMEGAPTSSGPWTAIAGFATAAITTAGDQYATDELTTGIPRWIRATATVAATNWNDGIRVEAWVIGVRAD